MSDWAEEWKSRYRFFQDNFQVSQSEIAVSFIPTLMRENYLGHLNYLLEGLETEIEGVGCSFSNAEEEQQFDGVKFYQDFTWSDPNDYTENILSYDQFLDLIKLSAQWHLRHNPQNETVLRTMFHSRNLVFGKEASLVVDNGNVWWFKCRSKYELTLQLQKFSDP